MDYNIAKLRAPSPKQPPPTRPSPKAPARKQGMTHTAMEEKLIGYVKIESSMVAHIPIRSHVRYIEKGVGPQESRFKIGGFVKSLIAGDNKMIKSIVLENKIGGLVGSAGYFAWTIDIASLDELWKKYSHESFIEIHMLLGSLQTKKSAIADLDTQVSELRSIVLDLKNKINKLEKK